MTIYTESILSIPEEYPDVSDQQRLSIQNGSILDENGLVKNLKYSVHSDLHDIEEESHSA